MSKLFDINNPIWRFMGRVADVFILTLLWALCSIPIITIGASTTALYYVTLKMNEGIDEYMCRSFWKAFKDNFIPATILWLILAVLFGGIGFTAYEAVAMTGRYDAMSFWMAVIIGIVLLLLSVMIFPLAARLDAQPVKLLGIAYVTSIKNFGWTLFMLVIGVCVTAIGVFVFWPVLLVAPGTIAYLQAMICVKMIFPLYGWNLADEKS